MLAESRIYSFIDQAEGFTLHFFEGQKIIHDLLMAQNVKGEGFHFFRDATLSLQHLISFLKPGEGFGVYIDSEEPYLRLKLEMSDQGQMRALILPAELATFPKSMTGILRTVKLLPGEKTPYTSMIKFQNESFDELTNKLFKESYQFESKIFLSDSSDQSVMLMKLPAINVNKVETHYRFSLEEYYQQKKTYIDELHAKHEASYEEIQSHFEKAGLTYLGSKEIQFKCSCSKERMLFGLWNLIKSSGIDNVFHEGEEEITTKCDYCNTEYVMKRSEFLN